MWPTGIRGDWKSITPVFCDRRQESPYYYSDPRLGNNNGDANPHRSHDSLSHQHTTPLTKDTEEAMKSFSWWSHYYYCYFYYVGLR